MSLARILVLRVYVHVVSELTFRGSSARGLRVSMERRPFTTTDESVGTLLRDNKCWYRLKMRFTYSRFCQSTSDQEDVTGEILTSDTNGANLVC